MAQQIERIGKTSKEKAEGGGDESTKTDTKGQRTGRLVAEVFATKESSRHGGIKTTTTTRSGPQATNERNENCTRPNTDNNGH